VGVEVGDDDRLASVLGHRDALAVLIGERELGRVDAGRHRAAAEGRVLRVLDGRPVRLGVDARDREHADDREQRAGRCKQRQSKA
jgi:hypothetical protein